MPTNLTDLGYIITLSKQTGDSGNSDRKHARSPGPERISTSITARFHCELFAFVFGALVAPRERPCSTVWRKSVASFGLGGALGVLPSLASASTVRRV